MPIDTGAQSNTLPRRLVAILLTAAIFGIDALTSLGTAIAVLYALVIILSTGFLDRRGLLTVSAICLILTLAGFFVGHGDSFARDPTIRCAVSLCAIVFTTVLALRNQESQARVKSQAALLDLTHDAIFVRDENDTITYWNRGAEQLYGWKAQEAVGRNSVGLLQTRFPAEIARIEAELLASGRWEGEVSQLRRDGTAVMIASRWSLHRDGHGKPQATMETNSDITSHRAAEDALRKAQGELQHVARITTLGELAASIAHEINQPLAAIVSHAQAGLRWLDRDPPNVETVRVSLEKMVSNAGRASDVIARLRSFARRSDTEYAPLSINDVVDDTLGLVQREITDRRVNLDLAFDAAAPAILGDRVLLQQVILNLVMNALQAMENVDGKRELRITTRQEAGKERMIVVLDVSDSGVGIDSAAEAKLFAAFFSTKSNGMGMGLSISRSIIEAHEGLIEATANPDAGATFTVRLPATAAEASR